VARLEVLYAGRSVRLIQLDTPRLVVGRSPQADLVLRHDTVSRKHCEIEEREGQHYLKDLLSTTGIVHDEQEVGSVLLTDGTDVSVGPYVLRYLAVDEVPPREAEPASQAQHWAALGDAADDEGEDVEAASTLTDGQLTPVKEQYKRTAIASAGQMRRLRDRLMAKQGPHLLFKLDGVQRIEPLAQLPWVAAHDPGADLPLPGRPWFGRRCFSIERDGGELILRPLSRWASVYLDGRRVRHPVVLHDGIRFRCRDIRFRFGVGG
jgi:predicted component of type VI protein secretion system